MHRFKVVSFSSEDNDYPATELNTVNPNTKGWQSVRFCPYPQEIGFQILDSNVKLTQIQVLSHQYKISTKVEIFIGHGTNYSTAKFKRLGYLSLDSNERSNFQARELKTVFIDHAGQFIKFLVNENHVNKLNIYNQVGIVAVSLMGTESSENDNGYERDVKAVAPARHPTNGSRNMNPYNDLTMDMNLDPTTAAKLRQLAEAKFRAVDNEDYLMAKQIKGVESELKTMGSRLAQLDMAKSEAVAAEDYDLAKEIKDESDELRSEIEAKVIKDYF